MEEIYCKMCGKKINNIPIIGEKYFKFEDGYYCQKCAEIKVKKARRTNE